MATTEHVLHLRRHLDARDPRLPGKIISVRGGAKDETTLVGNGVYPDRHAHLRAGEYAKAEEIGKTLYVPGDAKRVLLHSSPLPRTQETERHLFLGMVDAWARSLGVGDPMRPTPSQSRMLSNIGLHNQGTWQRAHSLGETRYLSSESLEDEGNELVAQAYSVTANPSFPGYRWMVQKGLEGDYRSEHPTSVAGRAFGELIPALMRYGVVLSVTHQPNLEIVTATLTGDLGTDGNKVFANAGGPFDVGGGIELRVQIKDGRIGDAQLQRTEDADRKKVLGKDYDGTKLVRVMPLDVGTLIQYAGAIPVPTPLPEVGFGD